MDRPSPQTADLAWAEDGAPRSTRYGDIYFSPEDGLAESRAVFLEGCGLPDAWNGRRAFTVGELGFGSGLNICALLDLWARTRPPGARLHVFSIEAHPLSAADAARALSAFPEVEAQAASLLRRWPPSTPGFHRIDLPEHDAVLDLAVGPVDWALAEWSGAADAWFLDGFSPALNPAMWSEPVMAAVAARSRPGARAATFTVAGHVRRALQAAGFEVEKRPGHGRKRERLEARLPGDPSESPSPMVAVVGAGIAGASVTRALHALGLQPLVVDPAGGDAASSFPAALVTPRLDVGDAAVAGFYAQALERARALYREVPGAVTAETVLQFPGHARDSTRFARICEQDLWLAGEMALLNETEAGSRLGEASGGPALLMRRALAVRPAVIRDAWLSAAPWKTSAVKSLQRTGSGWRLLDGENQLIAEVPNVILAAGWGLAGLSSQAPLRPVRGQAEWVEGLTGTASAWGGYVAPGADGLLFGATHDRDDIDISPRLEDRARNLRTLAARLPRLAERLEDQPIESRAAIRATTPDRLPICGQVDEGLFVLAGLGSRGFCAAPLLGEHVAALVKGTPSPLPTSFAGRLHPLRFAADRLQPHGDAPS